MEISCFHHKLPELLEKIIADLFAARNSHDILAEDKICNCGTMLVRTGKEISEQLKYIPA